MIHVILKFYEVNLSQGRILARELLKLTFEN